MLGDGLTYLHPRVLTSSIGMGCVYKWSPVYTLTLYPCMPDVLHGRFPCRGSRPEGGGADQRHMEDPYWIARAAGGAKISPENL